MAILKFAGPPIFEIKPGSTDLTVIGPKIQKNHAFFHRVPLGPQALNVHPTHQMPIVRGDSFCLKRPRGVRIFLRPDFQTIIRAIPHVQIYSTLLLGSIFHHSIYPVTTWAQKRPSWVPLLGRREVERRDFAVIWGACLPGEILGPKTHLIFLICPSTWYFPSGVSVGAVQGVWTLGPFPMTGASGWRYQFFSSGEAI